MSARKTLPMLFNVLTTVVFACAVCFTVVVVATTLVSGRSEASLLGWKPYIVLSDSMQSEFEVGDIAVSRAVDPAALQPGDIVTFASVDPDSYGEVFTHKIRDITEYEGERAFVTYGTTTGDDDAYPAPFSRVWGSTRSAFPKRGTCSSSSSRRWATWCSCWCRSPSSSACRYGGSSACSTSGGVRALLR